MTSGNPPDVLLDFVRVFERQLILPQKDAYRIWQAINPHFQFCIHFH